MLIPKEEEEDDLQVSTSTLSMLNLSDRAYFWHAVILHASCLILAILVEKIDVIFDLAGAICCAFSIFLFPAIGYLVAHHRYSGDGAHARNQSKCDYWLYLIFSWVFLALSLIIIAAAIYINVLRASGKLPQEPEFV